MEIGRDADLQPAGHRCQAVSPSRSCNGQRRATSPNAAQMVADAMESENWPEVTGILAGSGTLFLATARPEDQRILLDRFRLFLKRSGPPGVDHADRPEEPGEEEAEVEPE